MWMVHPEYPLHLAQGPHYPVMRMINQPPLKDKRKPLNCDICKKHRPLYVIGDVHNREFLCGHCSSKNKQARLMG